MSGVHSVSLCAVKMTAFRRFDNGTESGKAVMSGFLWRHGGNPFLVTNWHNVTGINPNTEIPMGDFTPTHFSCEFKCEVIERGTGRAGTKELSLFDADGNSQWIEHPDGRLVDVVAIPFQYELPENHQFKFINEQDYEVEWHPRIGDDGFIVGFPEGFSGLHTTPIWKRGSVATEPSLNHQDRPMFLLDTIGNAGLSGSPVIGRGSGVFNKGENGDGWTGTQVIGTWENFIGIYSGRMSSEGIGSQLGRVWKASVLEEIFHTID